jgi:hypothetical protein
MAHVAGVLLDHVQVDQPQRHGLAAVHEGVVQGRVGHGRVGELEFLGQPRIIGGSPGRVSALEIGVWLIPERAVDLLACEPLPEPGALDLCHMADQPEQGQARRRHGAFG